MSDLNHEDAHAELSAVALDSAQPDVRDAVRAHAAACPDCGPELAALEETVATLGHLVPSAQMNRGRGAGIRSRLVMRARAEREAHSSPVTGRPDLSRGVASLTGLGRRGTPQAQRAVTGETNRVTPARSAPAAAPREQRSGSVLTYYAAAATIALIATGAQLIRVTSERREMRGRIAGADTLAPMADSLKLALARNNQIIESMTAADVKVVQLATTSSAEPLGRVMWNRATNDWMIVAHKLRAPRAGMIYQVWLVTDGAPVSAGMFRPDSAGSTMMHAKYALERNALRSVTITEEPEGGVPSPTGPVVAAGPG